MIIGIDPGINKTGFGIISEAGFSPKYIESGTIKNRTDMKQSEKLNNIFSKIELLIQKYEVKSIILEETFVNSNPNTSMILGYARGIIILLAGIHNLPLYEYAPNHIKKTLTGNGHASKEQIQYMVRKILNIRKEFKNFDESDALAIALTHKEIPNALANVI